jgi:YqxM protein
MINKIFNFILNKLNLKSSSIKRTNEGWSKIRFTRLKKFKTIDKRLIIAANIVAIWYLLILTGSYLISNTGAAFNDLEIIKNSIQTQWDNDEWDKSSFSFDNSKSWAVGCTNYTTIKNAGDKDMTFSTWRYYLYKFDNGKPIGDPVATGVVPNIRSNVWGEISAEVSENGTYAFTVRRPLGHPGKNNPDENGYTYIGWSNPISVTKCKTTSASNNTGVKKVISDTKQPEEVDIKTQTNNVEVTDLSLDSNDSVRKITLNWENPTDLEFSHVRIYVEGQAIPIKDNIVNKMIDLEIKNTDSTIYRIATVDNSGKNL